MKKLTIGLFVEHWDPFTSGVITSTKALRYELEKRGHRVYIICPSVRGYKETDPHVVRIPGVRLAEIDNTTMGYILPGTLSKLKKIKFDIIHLQEVFSTGMIGLYLAKKQKAVYVQGYHTIWSKFFEQAKLPWHIKPQGWISAAVILPLLIGPKKTLNVFTYKGVKSADKTVFVKQLWAHMITMGNEADWVISPSQHLAKTLKNNGLTTPLEVIPNGAVSFTENSSRLLPVKNPKTLRILSVARLSPEKRVEVLVSSMHKTKHTELILVGTGPDKVELEQLADKLGVLNNVRFMGELSNSATREIMCECDVLALASNGFDNQPMVILEALDAGLPIIYCDGNLTEGLSQGNSLLVGESADDFRQGFKKLQNRKLLSKMAQASKKMANQYSAKTMTDKVLRVYEKALRSK